MRTSVEHAVAHMKEVRRPLFIEQMVAGIREDWQPKGETPERTLCRDIHAVNRRRLQNGEPPALVQMSDGRWVHPDYFDPTWQAALETGTATLMRLSWRQAEVLVSEVYRRAGARSRVVGCTGDGGFDVHSVISSGFGITTSVKTQVRRRSERMRPRHVREVRGTLNPGERGVLASVGGFTRAAHREARLSKTTGPVALLDARDIVDLAIRLDLLTPDGAFLTKALEDVFTRDVWRRTSRRL
jgi:hypothetical protein